MMLCYLDLVAGKLVNFSARLIEINEVAPSSNYFTFALNIPSRMNQIRKKCVIFNPLDRIIGASENLAEIEFDCLTM